MEETSSLKCPNENNKIKKSFGRKKSVQESAKTDEGNTKSQATKRGNEFENQKSKRNKSSAVCTESSSKVQSKSTKELRLKKDRERKRDFRNKVESKTQCELRLKKNRERNRERNKNLSKEEKELRRKKDRERKREKRKMQSIEERNKIKEKDAACTKRSRQNESISKRDERLVSMRNCKRQRSNQMRSNTNELDTNGWNMNESKLQELLKEWKNDEKKCNIASSVLHSVMVYYINSGYF